MGFADHYLGKQHFFFQQPKLKFDDSVEYCIVIPCYNEDNLVQTLESIWKCDRPRYNVLLIIVVNSSETSSEEVKYQNLKTVEAIKNWQELHVDPHLQCCIIYAPDLPEKSAGVGMARKIGMDAAIRIFNEVDRGDGILVSLDADCTVENNYLIAIESAFNSGAQCAVLYFEHVIEKRNKNKNKGIAEYELHLRYHNVYLRHISFPYAWHTVGSCFAVKARCYSDQGGMNRKKGGEDFYFLQKLFPVYFTIEINNTTVYPSARISDRVPFGTGPALRKTTGKDGNSITTYQPKAYEDLKILFDKIPFLFKIKDTEAEAVISSMPESVSAFLFSKGIIEKVSEITKNTVNKSSFTKRFYSWFNAFMVIKYLNFSSLKYYPKIPVVRAASYLLTKLGKEFNPESDCFELLSIYRNIQKNKIYSNPQR